MNSKSSGSLHLVSGVLLAFSAMPSAAAPQVQFSTYLGGSAGESPAGDMFVDGNGYIYLAGVTSSADFPVTEGAFDTTYNDAGDAFVMKLDPDGKLVWSTFLGTKTRDVIYTIKVDDEGYIYLAGAFGDGAPTTPGVVQETFAGMTDKPGAFGDGYVAKMRPDGSGLVWATYLGTQASESLRGMDIDADGNPVVVSNFKGADWPSSWFQDGWPAAWFRNGYQRKPRGGVDNVIIKLSNDGRRVLWASYLGGSRDESADPNIKIGENGMVHILTDTRSDDMPTSTGGHDRSHNGGMDIYLASISADGRHLLMGTYLGTGKNDGAGGKRGIALDGQGNIFISSWTQSDRFPLTSGACQREPMSWTPWKVTGITAKFTPAGELLASSYIGDPEGLSVDSHGNVYVTHTVWSDVLPVTGSAFQQKFPGKQGGALIVMSGDLEQIHYATYLGGSDDENARITAVGPDDVFYAAGTTRSEDFPLNNPVQPSLAGEGDIFLVKFSPLDTGDSGSE